MESNKSISPHGSDYWEAFETRVLPMPDGTFRPFRQKRIYWGSFDFIVMHWCSEKQLVKLAVKDAEEKDEDLDRNFGNCIAWLEREYHRIHDIPYSNTTTDSFPSRLNPAKRYRNRFLKD